MENIPPIKLTYNGDQEVEGTPENVTLYTFRGVTELGGIAIQNSEVNHVYVKLGEEEGRETTKGMYLFQKFHKEVFDLIVGHIVEYGYPQIVNMRRVPECDLRAYFKYKEVDTERQVEELRSELPDFLPEDFK